MSLLLPALLVLATLVGVVATARRRGPGWPAWALLQLLAGVALALLLAWPRSVPLRETLVVLTPGSSGAKSPVPTAESPLVALPGATAPAGALRVPDLATALRRQPGVSTLRVLGGGLAARAREAATGLQVLFEPGPAPTGIVALRHPAKVTAGSEWRVQGRVQGVAGARVELRDPGGRAEDAMEPGADGAFDLGTTARAEGRIAYTVAVLDRAGATVEATSIPLRVEPGAALRVLLLAGAPDPELRAWRRWAVDAGFELASRIALAPGLALRRGEATLDGDALARHDLLVADPRSWAAMRDAERAAIVAAVRDGLGLLLRINGPVPDAVREDWRDLGFAIAPADIAEGVALAAPPRATTWPELTRRPLEVAAADSQVMLAAADGSALARWRPLARGRIGAVWLTDSYKLATVVSPQAHGSLWSGIVRTLARARGAPAVELPVEARVDQRAVLCGLEPGATVVAPDGAAMALAIGAADAGACAAYWPAEPGWHTLRTGGNALSFHVRAPDEAPALEAAARRVATEQLARESAAAEPAPPPRSRWPAGLLFLAWLALAAAGWWHERRGAAAALG